MSAAPLFTSQAMAVAMGAARQGALPDDVTGLSIDSRTIRPGEAYCAIKGDLHDGHDYVNAALAAGAALGAWGLATRLTREWERRWPRGERAAATLRR